jgi:hypothetical protein
VQSNSVERTLLLLKAFAPAVGHLFSSVSVLLYIVHLLLVLPPASTTPLEAYGHYLEIFHNVCCTY